MGRGDLEDCKRRLDEYLARHTDQGTFELSVKRKMLERDTGERIVAFRMKDDQLSLLGQSPEFCGRDRRVAGSVHLLADPHNSGPQDPDLLESFADGVHRDEVEVAHRRPQPPMHVSRGTARASRARTTATAPRAGLLACVPLDVRIFTITLLGITQRQRAVTAKAPPRGAVDWCQAPPGRRLPRFGFEGVSCCDAQR